MEIDSTYEIVTNQSLEPGKRYVVVLDGVTVRKNVVVWHPNIPIEARNTEYDKLPETLKKSVDEAVVLYPSGDPAPKTRDQVILSFVEPETGTRFRYGFVMNFLPGGHPRKEFFQFCERVGIAIPKQNKAKLSELFKIGMRVSAVVYRDSRGYLQLERDSFRAEQYEEPATAADEPLTPEEAALRDAIIRNCDRLNGQDLRALYEFFVEHAAATNTSFVSIRAIWDSLNEKIKMVSDGKICL